MDKDFENSSKLIQQVKKESLYVKLLQQIQKDFVLANIPFELSLETKSEDIMRQLHEKIYVLIMEKFNEYLNLLYVVDIPEKSFQEIEMTDVVEIAEQVSYLILKREFQKVRLKAMYS